MGKGTQKTTSTYSPPGWVSSAYQNLLGRAQNVADTPYNPATERGIAGFTAPQTQAFRQTQQAQGIASPYISEAANFARRGATEFDPSSISTYMNPFQRNVIETTLGDIARNNAIQQSALKGNAASLGALGGDRAGIAQAELARGQDEQTARTLANLNAENYNQAVSRALQAHGMDTSGAFSGASALSVLGTQAQDTAYRDIGALLDMGGQQQEQEQRGLDIAAANAQARQAYPFDTTSWLANLSQGFGSSAGGTTTQRTPSPSPISQIAGLGLTGVGLIGGTGGFGPTGWFSNLFADGGLVRDDKDHMDDLISRVGRATEAIGTIKRASGGRTPSRDDLFRALIQQESGGDPNALNPKTGAMGLGQVMPATARDPGFGIAPLTNPFNAEENKRFSRDYFNAMFDKYGDEDPEAALAAYNWGPGNVDNWISEGRTGTLPDETQNYVKNIMAMAGPGGQAPTGIVAPSSATGIAAPGQPAQDTSEGGINLPLVAAGLGILSSQSPYPGVAIGQGGLKGLDVLLSQRSNRAKAAQLAAQAEESAKRLGLQQKTLEERIRHNKALEGVRQDKVPSGIQEYRFAMQQREAAGQEPISFEEWKKTTKSPLVTIEGEKEYSKARGKALAEEFGTMMSDANSARDRISQLNQIDELLSDPNIYTGVGAEKINAVKRIGKSLFGLDFEGVGAADAARRVSSEMALAIKQDIKDPQMSNSDREFLLSLPPNISDTTEGRKLLIQLELAKQNRKIEVAKFAREYRSEHGKLDDGWYDALDQWAQANPLVTPEMIDQAKQAAASSPQPNPTAGWPTIELNGKVYYKKPDGGYLEAN